MRAVDEEVAVAAARMGRSLVQAVADAKRADARLQSRRAHFFRAATALAAPSHVPSAPQCEPVCAFAPAAVIGRRASAMLLRAMPQLTMVNVDQQGTAGGEALLPERTRAFTDR